MVNGEGFFVFLLPFFAASYIVKYAVLKGTVNRNTSRNYLCRCTTGFAAKIESLKRYTFARKTGVQIVCK